MSDNQIHTTQENKKPSLFTMFMRLIALILGFSGVVLLITGIAEFIVSDLIIGAGLLVAGIWLFKRNRVTYKRSDSDKDTQQGMLLGHLTDND